MGDFKKLEVWQTAHLLALEVYAITSHFPRSEAFGLTSQLRSAAGSVAANIAEGCGRNTDGELARFARISLGSAAELENHLILAKELGLLDQFAADKLSASLQAIQRMLSRLVRRLGTERGHRQHGRGPITDS